MIPQLLKKSKASASDVAVEAVVRIVCSTVLVALWVHHQLSRRK
jgi:hypothetical protein